MRFYALSRALASNLRLLSGQRMAFEQYGGVSLYASHTLPAELQVGRYSSIAIDVHVLGEEHPTHWAMMYPITYDFVGTCHSFDAAHQSFGIPPFEIEQPVERLHPYPTIGHDVWIGQM